MFDCNWPNKRDEDADACRKLIARQQKPVVVPSFPYQQGSPQFTPARRSHSASPVMTGLGYNLAMAMEGLSMGPAGLTRTNQPMMMNGPPLPNESEFWLEYEWRDKLLSTSPADASTAATTRRRPVHGFDLSSNLSSKCRCKSLELLSSPHITSASTDSSNSYTKTMSLKPEISATRQMPTMDGGSILRLVPPPLFNCHDNILIIKFAIFRLLLVMDMCLVVELPFLGALQRQPLPMALLRFYLPQSLPRLCLDQSAVHTNFLHISFECCGSFL
jgi:hypothetical protein